MQSSLNKRIMRRIYIVYVMRLLGHPLLVKAVMMTVLFVYSSQYVSYGAVVSNMPMSATKLPTFIGVALANTEYITLGLLFAVLVLFLYVIRDVRLLGRARAVHI
ncbi:MAG: hypothetical protein Q8Q18_02035 [bacterium]|nr:hypothetical protein [bacterium]